VRVRDEPAAPVRGQFDQILRAVEHAAPADRGPLGLLRVRHVGPRRAQGDEREREPEDDDDDPSASSAVQSIAVWRFVRDATERPPRYTRSLY
jgi:hypothetical protein